MSCKSCHTCGTTVRIVLDGEEWCDTCQTYRRPASHGWGRFPGQTRAELLSAFLPDWTEILVPLHRKIAELAGHRSPSPGIAP